MNRSRQTLTMLFADENSLVIHDEERTSNKPSWPRRRKVRAVILALALLVIVAAIGTGIGLGLDRSRRTQTEAATTATATETGNVFRHDQDVERADDVDDGHIQDSTVPETIDLGPNGQTKEMFMEKPSPTSSPTSVLMVLATSDAPSPEPSSSSDPSASIEPSSSMEPSASDSPSGTLSQSPSTIPSNTPSATPTALSSDTPTSTTLPTEDVSTSPRPSTMPSINSSSSPSIDPTNSPSSQPTLSPSRLPTESPSKEPTEAPTKPPTPAPTISPSALSTVRAWQQAQVTLSDGIMYEIVEKIGHDKSAFTQGLCYSDGTLYESTGLYGRSSIRILNATTGSVVRKVNMHSQYFGEGMTTYTIDGVERLIQITWRKRQGFIYDPATLRTLKTFSFSTTKNEGWGITFDAEADELIVSDGSNVLHFWDPATLALRRTVSVTRQNGSPATNLNELEFWRGRVLANVWYQDVILVIHPTTGVVEKEYDMSSLWPEPDRIVQGANVLNGISVSEDPDILYVTGKLWDRIFRLKLLH